VSGVTVSDEGIVTGNTYDKYGSSNPVVRRLMTRFEHDLEELFEAAAPTSVLDVGCGEGVLVHRWAQRLGGPDSADAARVVGIDLEEDSIQAGWAERQAPNLEYRVMHAANLPFAADEFDFASAIEVLEHVPDPAHTVAEMARCAQRHRQHARPSQPLVQALVRRAALASRRGRRGALAVPLDDVACPTLSPPPEGGRPSQPRTHRAAPASGSPATARGRGSCRSGSPRRAC
jgi:SAM-dependent methyltransferase